MLGKKIKTTELIKSLESYLLEAAYGKAMLQANCLEKSFTNLLITKLTDKKLSEEIFNSKLAKLRKLTMGGLINEIIKEFEISDYWQQEFDNALFFRNRLTHKISDDIFYSYLETDGKNKLVLELDEVTSFFNESNNEVRRMTDEWLNLKGIKKSQLVEVAKGLMYSRH